MARLYQSKTKYVSPRGNHYSDNLSKRKYGSAHPCHKACVYCILESNILAQACVVVLLLLLDSTMMTYQSPFVEMASFPVWWDVNSNDHIEKRRASYFWHFLEFILFQFLRQQALCQHICRSENRNVYIVLVDVFYNWIVTGVAEKYWFVPPRLCVYDFYTACNQVFYLT